MFYILNCSRNSFYLKDNLDRITHLYFSKDSCQSTLMTNPDVLIMDCTYKTNRYKLPLISTMGTTALNTSFYVGFAFLRQERKEDYVWFLQQLKTLYRMLNISYPKVVVTDRDIGLMAAIYSVFLTHVICYACGIFTGMFRSIGNLFLDIMLIPTMTRWPSKACGMRWFIQRLKRNMRSIGTL